MIKTMTARYAGRDAQTGQRFNAGAEIRYDTATRKAWLSEAPIRTDYVSHVIDFGDGREYYRNKNGRCEDAPCCGCCTI
jgi:hypothetical protein